MFPKGGMSGLMKQAQEMQKKMKKLEGYLLDLRIEGSSSGKLVLVTADGKKNIKSIKIDSSILSEEAEMVEDLVMAAIKQAYNNIDKDGSVGDAKLGGKTLDTKTGNTLEDKTFCGEKLHKLKQIN